MEWKSTTPRAGWQDQVAGQGLTFHTDPTGPYWDESHYFEFSRDRTAACERATHALYALSLRACDRIVRDPALLRTFCGESRELSAYIEDSWRNSDPSLYLFLLVFDALRYVFYG